MAAAACTTQGPSPASASISMYCGSSDVSFYTTELPQYMLIEAIRGLGPGVVNLAAAMTYTLLVLLAGLLAKGGAGGREGRARFLLAAGIVLAPQLSATSTLLQAPDHTGTAVALLVVWLVIDRARPHWLVPVAVCAMLAWIMAADSIVLLTGIVPIAVAAGLATLQLVAQPRFLERIETVTATLIDGLKREARAAGVDFSAQSIGSMFGIYFRDAPPKSFAEVMQCDREAFNRFFHAMLERGVYLAPSAYEAGFVSSAHGPAELEATFGAARAAFAIAMGR